MCQNNNKQNSTILQEDFAKSQTHTRPKPKTTVPEQRITSQHQTPQDKKPTNTPNQGVK